MQVVIIVMIIKHVTHFVVFMSVMKLLYIQYFMLYFGCLGLIMAVVTMPLETAKNRMAFQKPDPVTGAHPPLSSVYPSSFPY